MPLQNLPPHVAAVLDDAIEITLPTPDNFLKVRETLTRMGVASKRDLTLYQSCHILHKRGVYFLLHFKQLFLLDGKVHQTQYDDIDKLRLSAIANLLHQWKLVEIVDPARVTANDPAGVAIDIIPFRDKGEWTLVSKYQVGKKR